ncbi:MAG: hypothetical protein WDO14_17840 [Bacteroidota bacterium]
MKSNPTLYDSVLEFDPDQPMSEYTFSVRLAKENFWTYDFTRRAIIEYKRFMYLAAISDAMVSPSKIVDAVWHQHLTFTHSYSDLCKLLGKNIQHVPSTRSRFDAERFQAAKGYTKKLYKEEFGEAPKDIWDFDTMYDSLNLPKAKFKIRTVIITGLMIAAVLLIPAYFLLRPIYTDLGSGMFFAIYISSIVLVFVVLAIIDRQLMRSIVNSFDRNSFIFSLDVSELVFLKKQKSEFVVHLRTNKMIANGKLDVDKDGKIKTTGNALPVSAEEHIILKEFWDSPGDYGSRLKYFGSQPAFTNANNVMMAFGKFFIKSKAFGNLFYLNFGVIMLMILPGAARLMTGLVREKPVGFLVALLLGLAFASFVFLSWLSYVLIRKEVLSHYVRSSTTGVRDNAEWDYFYTGAPVATFAPVITSYYATSSSSGSGSGSDLGSESSCGSDGGSSCGGCGGGD